MFSNVMSALRASEKLGKRERMRVRGTETWLVRIGFFSRYAIVYRGTNVVTIDGHDDGQTTYTIRTNGFRTATTKRRIKCYSPAKIVVRKGEWFIDGQPFRDGAIVDRSGNLIGFFDESPASSANPKAD